MRERGNSILKALDYYLGVPLTAPAALFRHCSKLSCKPEARRIAILCQGAIGDLLLATALINGIRAINPSAHVEVLSSMANAPALELLPSLSAATSFPVTRPDLFIRHLRKNKFDILLDTSQWTRLGAIISSLSDAGMTIGFATRGQCRALGYDLAVPHNAAVHEVQNFLALGQAVWPHLTGKPGLHLKPMRHDAALACFHMWPARGNGRRCKQWPEDHWDSLAKELLARDFRIVLTGSPADAPDTEDFLRRHFPREKSVQSIAGKYSLPELARVIAGAGCMVAVNTGIMHLAALTGIPTVGLHGATNPTRWGPVGANSISLLPRSGPCAYLNLGFEYPPHVPPAMANLPVEDVLLALEKLGVW